MKEMIIFPGLTCFGLILILASYVIREVVWIKKEKCWCKVKGKVCSYDYPWEEKIAPVLSYTVEGKSYECRKKFSGYIWGSFREGAPLLEEDKNGRLRINSEDEEELKKAMHEYWQPGSEMTVWYNPDNPEDAYVDRPVMHISLAKSLFITGFIIAIFSYMLFFLA